MHKESVHPGSTIGIHNRRVEAVNILIQSHGWTSAEAWVRANELGVTQPTAEALVRQALVQGKPKFLGT